MTEFRNDTSFPFLAIAHRFSVPYERVMRIADGIESHRTYLLMAADAELHRAIGHTIAAERQRRADAS